MISDEHRQEVRECDDQELHQKLAWWLSVKRNRHPEKAANLRFLYAELTYRRAVQERAAA